MKNFFVFLIFFGYNCNTIAYDATWPISFEKLIRLPFLFQIMELCLYNKGICSKSGMIVKGMLYAVLNNPPDNFSTSERLSVLYGLKILKTRNREEFDIFIQIYNLSNYYADFRV